MAVNLSEEKGFPFWHTAWVILLGWIQSDIGNTSAGITIIRNTLVNYETVGRQWQPFAYFLLSDVCRKVGLIEDGLQSIGYACNFIEQTDERWWETEVIKLKGELLLAQSSDNQTEAEACFNKAIEIAQSREAKYFELMATMSLCRLWRDQGRRQEARDKLEQIYGWYTEGFETPYLKEAKALLDELG